MTDKVLTLASKQAADDLKAAVFKKYQADELARRGDPALDCYAGIRDAQGRKVPLPVQVTTQYVDAPPPKYADPEHPTAKELSDYEAAKLVQVAVDATVEAMQGAKVDVGGKQVTIDVSAAVPVTLAGAQDESVKGG